MHFRKLLFSSSCLSSSLVSSFICASNLVGPPSSSAGIVEKQIQKEYSDIDKVLPKRDLPLLKMDIPDTTLNIPLERPVFINHVEFTGNLAVHKKRLAKIAEPYLGRDLKGEDVEDLCQAVQDYYVQKGYILACVYPPVQDIKDQTLTIHVMEGVLGHVKVQGNKHYSARFIQKHFKPYIGKAVNYNQLIRALLLLNDNSDLSVGAVFEEGDRMGEVCLVIVVKDKRPLHIYTDYNNYGSSITTLHREGTRIDCGNLITSGDKLSLVEVIGFPFDHLNYSNAIYSVPLTGSGLKLELSYLYSRFKVDRFNVYHLSGESNIAGARLSRALARTRRLSTDISVSFEYKQLKNEVLGEIESYDKLRVLELRGDLDYIDALKGRNVGDLYFSIGLPSFLGGLNPIDSLCSREGAGGRFFILNLDYKRVQQLPLHWFIVLNASGQGTLNKIPISEQFYIGGIDTVRGYPLATALGDNGYYGNLELNVPLPFWQKKRIFRKQLKDALRFIGFVDQGGVFDNSHVTQEKDPSYLTSTGFGARFYGPWNFYVNFDVGFPLTEQHKSSDTILYFKVGLKLL